ncbi:MAG: sulfotransferase [Anaerolineaceae bacterium]|nr:sulfotransferase [Anaerolineaceae bacterium]
MKEYTEKHSQTEQFLHHLAFKPWYPRVPLANIETNRYKNQLAAIQVDRPVFITALPRAGTTFLLKLCVETGEFASHTYRDMPFIFTPINWSRYSRHFRKSSMLAERVHGDGILVNENSPESFEEILWKEFWPSHYKKDRVIPWKDLNYPDFESFFQDHMRKIIFLRGDGDKSMRYVSKNNLNIARIKYLRKAFPEAKIILLFRTPLQHASSLLRQHRNFLKIHSEDLFAQKYMEDTAHFDFGDNLRPVDFNGWFSKGRDHNPNTLAFWLEYWINTYQYQLNELGDQAIFFSYDSFCKDPQSGLKKLAKVLELSAAASLTGKADQIKKPKPHEIDVAEVPQALLLRAEETFHQLIEAGGRS